MHKLAGITGGIGSGKSTVSEMFGLLGIPVYDADSRARWLMNHKPTLVSAIKDLLGEEAYSLQGQLDRPRVAARVFNDPDLLSRLNALVHPAVYADLLEWASLPLQQEAPYLIQESAILFEENLVDRFEAVILVCAPEALRIRRVMERDGVPEENVRKRMEYQWPDDRKIPLSDYVLFNDGRRPLIRQVLDVDRMLRVRFGRMD